MIAIFDLDDTLSLTKHRQHFLKEKPKNWEDFTAACVNDRPNMPIINTLRSLAHKTHSICIISGRSESVRRETVSWLNTYRIRGGIEYDVLYMRPLNDFRDDREVKKEQFGKAVEAYRSRSITPCNEDFIIFDDRQKVVDMWREMGLTCCQVAKGDF